MLVHIAVAAAAAPSGAIRASHAYRGRRCGGSLRRTPRQSTPHLGPPRQGETSTRGEADESERSGGREPQVRPAASRERSNQVAGAQTTC